MTQKWYATHRHPKMHPHTKFGIPTSKNIGDMDRTRKRDGHTDGRTDGRTDSAITICLPKFLWGHKKCSEHDYSKTRSEVKVTVTQKWYATLGHSKKHPHTKFGSPTSKNIEVMTILVTRSEIKVTVIGKWNRTIRHSKMHLHSKFGIPT